MIVSASYRTDIPAFYGSWFANRLRAGFCRVLNPYGGSSSLVPLRDGVDGFVFWTRDIGPFLPVLDLVAKAGIPFVIQYTLTGYPKVIERATPPASRATALIRGLAETFGPRVVVWRYDPILLSSVTPPNWHRANFTALADILAGAVDEVVTSFVEPYAKTRRAMDRAAAAGRFSWRPARDEEKRGLLSDLTGIAQTRKMRLGLCTQPALVEQGWGEAAACIDGARLSDRAGRPIAFRRKGNRTGCFCAESRDIGAYESCPQGCAYCYASGDPDTARRKHAAHDPEDEFLFAPRGLRRPD